MKGRRQLNGKRNKKVGDIQGLWIYEGWRYVMVEDI